MAKDNKDKEQANAAQAIEAETAKTDTAPPEAPAAEAQNYGKEPEELEAAKQPKPAETKKPKAGDTENSAKGRAVTPLKKEAIRILNGHPGQDTVYMTADGFGYFNEHDARNHARDIKDDKLVIIVQ